MNPTEAFRDAVSHLEPLLPRLHPGQKQLQILETFYRMSGQLKQAPD